MANVRMSQPGTPATTQPNYMKVFIQRDYSEGTSVKFQNRFPPELESRVRLVGVLLIPEPLSMAHLALTLFLADR